VYKTNTNFVLCKIKGINCDELYDFCMKKGIIIRRASNFKDLDDHYVRFAIKDRYKNDLLLSILETVEV
jgi:threonine-phosphate decarboxylase